ncbi:hypothetical protein T4E_8023 [Trichinella pseudospiralis]|uniref:Uncharacterized protein n=1 Tax=Trichinella pseudospiralis TaxID=6337 RepID=A0A0V0Y001_TRIPS|nr:hypothetical protein T4E_8023 [Trichinella pseudospiralis]
MAPSTVDLDKQQASKQASSVEKAKKKPKRRRPDDTPAELTVHGFKHPADNIRFQGQGELFPAIEKPQHCALESWIDEKPGHRKLEISQRSQPEIEREIGTYGILQPNGPDDSTVPDCPSMLADMMCKKKGSFKKKEA